MHQPKYICKDWADIGTFYSTFSTQELGLQKSCSALGELCKTINESHLKQGLFAHNGSWVRVVKNDELLPCFDKFLRQLGWNSHDITPESR
jgi:hypothetical protein